MWKSDCLLSTIPQGSKISKVQILKPKLKNNQESKSESNLDSKFRNPNCRNSGTLDLNISDGF